MTNPTLYRQHLQVLDRCLGDALERASRQGLKLNGVLFHAGRAASYHRDDQEIPFRAAPHFLRYVPLDGPEHSVLARPGQKPLVIRVAPQDFWYETTPLAAAYWQDEVILAEVASFEEILRVTGPLLGVAYFGNCGGAAAELGIPPELIEPDALAKPLDWHRAVKTDHEIALIEAAARRAAEGHRVGRKAFESGASEREIHWAYLQASGHLEKEVPFETIVALGDRSATLHYQTKRGPEATGFKTFLLDAGAQCDGYAADITRTWVLPGADPVFVALVEGVDAFERDLVAMVTAGRPYPDIHVEAHRRTARLLVETGIAKGTPEAVMELGITRAFLPHGVGHHLGLQVHDVGGRQAAPEGGINPPPAEYPFLRNTRVLEPGHVVTIEPGIYFIPMLLAPLKSGPGGKLVDWGLVERLTPCGGVRIEDDVLCAAAGPRDLTRCLIQGPRGV